MKVLRLKTNYFYTKSTFQKSMLRQIEWVVQNGNISKNVVFQVTTLFSWKFCFNLGTTYKELIWCTNYPNIHIHNFGISFKGAFSLRASLRPKIPFFEGQIWSKKSQLSILAEIWYLQSWAKYLEQNREIQ